LPNHHFTTAWVLLAMFRRWFPLFLFKRLTPKGGTTAKDEASAMIPEIEG
jgi:hypothetical protein